MDMDDDALTHALGARFDTDEERLRRLALRLLGAGAEREAETALARVREGLGTGGTRLLLAGLVVRACLTGEPGGEPSEAPAEGPGREVEEAVVAGFLLALGAMGPGERVAYLLHDGFGLAPGEAARVMGGTPDGAARRARGARRRLRGGTGGDGDARRTAEAFLRAARARDAVALARLLDPEAVAYGARGPVHGAPAAALAAAGFARRAARLRSALLEGEVGAVAFEDGRPVAAVALGFRGARIVRLEFTTGEEHVRALAPVFPDR
ncbi:RNA polymerase subunit sigma-70 [Streptomyces termitum]|uniref:RNA polymerase subunit sigma-70 n=1 Tax=Streptomyces termitum TaxID=67368 RepID=UPI00378BA8AD